MDNIHAMGTRSGKPLISADIRTSFLIWSCLLLLLGQSFQGHAQIFPVQSSTQLVPPYSVYLSDYATPGNEKLRVILVQRDLTQPSYQLRLVMQVEWNGKVIMRTSRAYNPAPISLDPGVPTIISGAELFPYLDSRNIDFVGYSREQYERTKALPEGSYRISFTAYDYRRQDVQVSNEGSSFYYLSKNEPPLINMPVCGAKVPVRQPQQVIFSWLPRNTSSPASASETQYEFSLYEIRPEGRNPNDVVLSSQPVFKTTIDYTQLVYGPAEPQLIENMRYAWRVRAIDTQGRDAFRNNGYSEVCTFTYGGVDPAFIVGGIEGLQAEGESERSARIWWEQGNFDSYRIYYKKSGEGYEWFTSDLLAKDLDPAKEEGELKLFDLEPDTEYETRAQAKKMGNLGPYTDIVKFRTLPVRVAHCGDPALLPEGGPGEPFREAIKGMTVDVDGMEMTLLDVVHLGDGYYQGLGRVSVDYLGGAAFTASFDRIFINTDRQVVLGRIDFVTNGVAVMAEEQLAAQKGREQERIKEANREEWKGTDFYGKIFLFDNIAIEDVTVDGPNINITDSEGNIHPNTEVAAILAANPGQAIIIEDKNGDQWVVEKDGDGAKVTKVEGGGLGAVSMEEVSEDLIAIVRKAMKALRKDNGDRKLERLAKEMERQRKELEKYIDTENRKVVPLDIVSTPSAHTDFYSEMMEDVDPPVETDNVFKQKSKDYKLAERAFNKAMVISIIASDNRKKKELAIVLDGVSYRGESLVSYLEQEKIDGKSEEELIGTTVQALTSFIESILNHYVYDIQ